MTQLTDILIPLGKGSRQNDLELRYCLRSIEKQLKGVGNVFIVGEKPEWLLNIIHVPCRDNPNTWKRAENIYRKIIAGCRLPDLSDNFLFMNDDHFLLQDCDLENGFPFYHRGEIETVNMINNIPQWRQYKNTINVVGIHALDYGIHSPIIYNKGLFKQAFTMSDWPEYGYEIKSLYCNVIGVKGELIEDLKFSQPAMKETIYRVLEGRSWFSIGDRTLKSGDMKEVLQELYPVKSKYEV